MIPNAELRRIIESSFTPLACSCQLLPGGTLTVEVWDPLSGRVELLSVGVPMAELTSMRAVNNLIAELRGEIKANQEWFERTHGGDGRPGSVGNGQA